jgi:hypothetical protein
VAEAVRRESPRPGEDVRAAAALGVIGSITMHRTSIAPPRAEDLLRWQDSDGNRDTVTALVVGALGLP